jgi:hypothetical protein
MQHRQLDWPVFKAQIPLSWPWRTREVNEIPVLEFLGRGTLSSGTDSYRLAKLLKIELLGTGPRYPELTRSSSLQSWLVKMHFQDNVTVAFKCGN